MHAEKLVGLHLQYSLNLPDLNKMEAAKQFFMNLSNIRFHGKSFSGSSFVLRDFSSRSAKL